MNGADLNKVIELGAEITRLREALRAREAELAALVLAHRGEPPTGEVPTDQVKPKRGAVGGVAAVPTIATPTSNLMRAIGPLAAGFLLAQTITAKIEKLLAANPSVGFNAEMVAAKLGDDVNLDTVRSTMARLAEAGTIQRLERGYYCAKRTAAQTLVEAARKGGAT